MTATRAFQRRPTPAGRFSFARSGAWLQRKCACSGKVGPGGGQCAECQRKNLLGDRTPLVQAKRMINQPGDRYEKEADLMADQVVRMPAPAIRRRPRWIRTATKRGSN